MEPESTITTAGTLEDVESVGGVHSATIFVNKASRDGVVIEPAGMDFGGYGKNPVVLYAHDLTGRTQSAGLPIGRTRRLVRTADGRLRADFEFLPGDAFADRVRNAWRRGFLRGASIGWRIIESRPSGGKLVVTKSELLEWSIVAVPADPDAVRHAYGRVMRSLLDSGGEIHGGDVDGDNDGKETIFETAETPDLSDAKRGIAELTRWMRANG